MNQAHAREQRNQTQGHDLVLLKEATTSNLPSSQARKDNDSGKDGTPPAEEESRPVSSTGAGLRRRSVPYSHALV
jgi:hypothetical protein